LIELDEQLFDPVSNSSESIMTEISPEFTPIKGKRGEIIWIKGLLLPLLDGEGSRRHVLDHLDIVSEHLTISFVLHHFKSDVLKMLVS
jgi:hypothetical protein